MTCLSSFSNFRMDSKVREETRSAMAAQALADYEARAKDTRRDRG